MNTDIRIATSFKGHRKRVRFETRIGQKGASIYIVDLWLTVAIDRPDGVLTGWDEIDIAIAAGWPPDQDPVNFVKILVETGWLDFNEGIYSVHDWAEHQVWACGARARAEHARKAAQAKWRRVNPCPSSAQAMPEHETSSPPILSSPSLSYPVHEKTPKGVGVLSYDYPDWLNKDLWADFKRMRSRIKKPITSARTITGLLNQLKNLINQGHDQEKIIQASIDHCWQDFYPPKQPAHSPSPGRPTGREPTCNGCGMQASNIVKGQQCPFCGGTA